MERNTTRPSTRRDHRLVLSLVTLVLLLAAGLAAGVGAEEGDAPSWTPDDPSFKDVLSLEGVGGPRISPDGTAVAYSVSRTEWDENRFDSELWLARRGEEPFQLTRTADGSSNRARWSPDGRWIAFRSDRGDGAQIWLIRPGGGEARPLTAVDGGVADYEWSPDGAFLAVTIREPESEEQKKLETSYGDFEIEDRVFRRTHLWLLDVAAALEEEGGAKLPEEKEDEEKDGEDGETEDGGDGAHGEDGPSSPFRRLTGGDDFTVDAFAWSPDGTRIAFDHAPDPRVESRSEADLSLVEAASGEVRRLVERPGPDGDPHWSPDGKSILFATLDGESAYYLNTELARVPADGGEPVVLTEGFDEDASAVRWLDDGVRFIALDHTRRRLYRLDPESGAVSRVEGLPPILSSVTFSRDGAAMAFEARDGDQMGEVFHWPRGAAEPVQVTHVTGQTADWPVGSNEIIRWQSRDGVAIEGVLIKPDGFDPAEKHPLLVIIHGGPAWLSFPGRVHRYVYPVQQWLQKGAVVLMPNYRGSAGYGEEFRTLNVRNLGVGDAWDVLSGVDHLVEQGYVDEERIGAMGWSQGGYITAFLATTSDRFAALSVGAGISDWMTYYVNTDIHPFTRHYLQATPWDDPEVYDRTSPMHYVLQASTPTLIQHGELDRRVPTPNAYQLYQGLQDVGVEVELIIYKGFGHGINKPKELLAAVWHNWRWFAKHVWDRDVEIPTE